MTPLARPHLPEPVGRRATITPIGLDVVVALAQDPEGLRLSPLAHAIEAPVSSVQAVLRNLTAAGLVARTGANPPRYRLAAHPARDALLRLALVLPEPVHVLSVILRASPAVSFAAVDRAGFIAAIGPSTGDAHLERLRSSIGDVADARDTSPPVELRPAAELARLLSVSVGSRARVASAIPLKGRLAAAAERRVAAGGVAARVR